MIEETFDPSTAAKVPGHRNTGLSCKLVSLDLNGQTIPHTSIVPLPKSRLGNQNFFTLLGYEFPNLIYRLNCVWYRQLCTWWKDHGYSDVFDKYFTCKGRIKMYHGNCNPRVPE
uniref:Uncharacterized protein n=1 Tax=Glossina palpalis gambiensis TaxID=67801 RepID=A0A1B0BA27_9MUSC